MTLLLNRRPRLLVSSIATALLLTTYAAESKAADADPSNYKTVISSLKPGDTLTLAAGTYVGLNVSGINGTENAPITITGPASGPPAIIVGNTNGCCNVVEIINASYIVVKNLKVDSLNLEGIFGLSAKDGASNLVHHITVEGCTFVGQGGSQQTVGISTKTPTWGWVIRGNTIDGAGTGMYLGNSNGDYPFIGGIVEKNLIKNTTGYNAQFKFQNPRPAVTGMPTSDSSTIIRNNVFIKDNRPSPDGDRPNLLVGGFPDSGAGSNDTYQIYGNLFYQNPREALLQVSGRVSIHDNIFVQASSQSAIVAQNHDKPLKLAYVYNNTVYAQTTGIRFGSKASQGDSVLGNLVFSATPIAGPITNLLENITAPVASAADYVNAPGFTLGTLDFYPKAGKCEGSALDLTAFASNADYNVDFNGASKGTFLFRGAYAGTGTNPGWKLNDGLKDTTGSGGSAGSGGSGGSAGTGGSAGGFAGMGGSAGGSAGTGGSSSDAGPGIVSTGSDDAGCGCKTSSHSGLGAGALFAMVGLGMILNRRRESRREGY